METTDVVYEEGLKTSLKGEGMSAGQTVWNSKLEFEVFSHQGCAKKNNAPPCEGIKRNIYFSQPLEIRLEQTWVQFCLKLLLVMMLLLNVNCHHHVDCHLRNLCIINLGYLMVNPLIIFWDWFVNWELPLKSQTVQYYCKICKIQTKL